MSLLFHGGWALLLLLFVLAARGGAGSAASPAGRVALQLGLAVAVVGWTGTVLDTVARDHGPGLEVLGYELRPPAEGPAVTTLGTGAPADVVLPDPHGAAVHARIDWDEDLRPRLWNSAADRRLERNGVELHDVELRSGMRLESPKGGLASGWELSVAADGSSVSLVDVEGAVRVLHLPVLRGLARHLPGVGPRLGVVLGRVVGAGDGSLRIAERGVEVAPGEGAVALIYLRDGVVRLGFAGPEDRATHPLRIRRGKRSFRPADRPEALVSGDVLTLGYSKYEVRLGAAGRVSLVTRSHPSRLPWPPEDATVFGPAPGTLLVGDEDGATLVAASMSEARGFVRAGGAWKEAASGLPRVEVASGERLDLPITESARVRLRVAHRGAPAAALAGIASRADGAFWRLLLVLAAGYLFVTLLAASLGIVHGRSAGVLHGSALLFGVGLVCLYRLSDPGDPRQVDWALHQARLGQFGLVVAAFVLLCVAAARRMRREAPRPWHACLDGPLGDGAPAARLYLLALGVLALQLPFGETGIAVPGLGSVQPIEPARTLLVVYLAYWTARAVEAKQLEIRGREGLRERWAYMVHALPVLGVLGLCYGVRDISPILVFVAFVGVLYSMSWVRPEMRWWPPSRLRESVGLEAVVLPLFAGGVLWLVLGDPGGTVARRVAVWWDPWSRGDDAYQAITALWTAASGGVWGLGWAGPNGVLPPAVRDDFILSLLGARGGAAAVTLVAATFAVVLLSGVDALSGVEGDGSPSSRERSGLLASAMLWMLVLQAGIVLGSSTGGLPVMGQPLPFVSAAGSHLLCFCFPAVAVVLGASRRPARAPARSRRPRVLVRDSGGRAVGPVSMLDGPVTLGGG